MLGFKSALFHVLRATDYPWFRKQTRVLTWNSATHSEFSTKFSTRWKRIWNFLDAYNTAFAVGLRSARDFSVVRVKIKNFRFQNPQNHFGIVGGKFRAWGFLDEYKSTQPWVPRISTLVNNTSTYLHCESISLSVRFSRPAEWEGYVMRRKGVYPTKDNKIETVLLLYGWMQLA